MTDKVYTAKEVKQAQAAHATKSEGLSEDQKMILIKKANQVLKARQS